MQEEQAINLLFADDDKLFLKYVQVLMKAINYNVFWASHGVEALEYAKTHTIAMAFLDYQMPLKNGLDTLIEWKKIQPATHIIIVSAYSEEDVVKRALREGASNYIFKPVNKADLFAVIDKYLNPKQKINFFE